MRSFSFSKADRILKRSDFIRLSESGKRIHNRYFLTVFCPGHERSRIGITVSRKVSHHAVIRNRLKRYCREYFRLNRDRIAGNWDINVIARKEAAEISAAQAFSSLKTVFERLSKEVGD
jgi:ribonuclease P protein component